MAVLTSDYANAGKRIDVSGCPRDFAEAYYRHLGAWSQEADAISAHAHIAGTGEALLEGFFRGLGGDITGGEFQHQDEFKAWMGRVQMAHAEVNRNWTEVEALAVRYGAR